LFALEKGGDWISSEGNDHHADITGKKRRHDLFLLHHKTVQDCDGDENCKKQVPGWD